MTYTEITTTSTTYKESKGDVTVWDNGATAWDVIGNVELTFWDEGADTSYTDKSSTSTTWTEL